MKIAQIAPLRASVPPKRHGGTERIVSYLTEELVRLGHEGKEEFPRLIDSGNHHHGSAVAHVAVAFTGD